MVFDIILIGSSPIIMVKALQESSLGNSVMIIEKDHIIGGSWQTINDNEIGMIESGCHVMYRSSEMNKFFKNEIGINFHDFNPQPIVAKGKATYNYKFISYLNHLELPFFKILKGIPRFIFEILNINKFKYPLGGSNEMISKLILKLKSQNIKILNGEVVGLNIRNGVVFLDNLNLKTKKLILTPNSKLQYIINYEKRYDISALEKRKVENLYIKFEFFEKIISYVGIKDKDIFRISDMTYNYHKNCRIYCVQLRADFVKDNSEFFLFNYVIDYLKLMKFITTNSVIIKYKFLPFYYGHRMFDEISFLEKKFQKNIEVLYTHNFTHGIKKVLN